MALYTWEFTILDEGDYVSVNHGFRARADNTKYDKHMKTCFFFYSFWGEYLEAKKIVDRIPVAADKAREIRRLNRQAELHFVTNLDFLPYKRTNFKSIADLQSVPAKKMRALKAANALAETVWDGGFNLWKTQNQASIPGWRMVQ